MVGMFMRNKNGFYLFHLQSQPRHPLFRFPAGDTGIYKDGFFIVADVVAIAIAAGIKRGNV
jgi:hypothetical protein